MPGTDPSRLPLEVGSTAESGFQSSSVLSAHVDSSTASTATHEANVKHSRCPGLLQFSMSTAAAGLYCIMTVTDNRTTITKHPLRSTAHSPHCVPASLQINGFYNILKIFIIVFSPAKIQQKGKITLLTPWPKLMGPIL